MIRLMPPLLCAALAACAPQTSPAPPRATLALAAPVLDGRAAAAVAAVPSAATTATIPCAGQDVAASINAAPPGSAVQLGAGTCMVGSTIQMSTGSALAGQGKGATVLRRIGTGFDMVDFGDGKLAGAVTGATLAHITMDGAATAVGATMAGSNIVVRLYSSGNTVADVETMHAEDSGIRLAGSGNTVTGVSTHDNMANGITVMGSETPNGTVLWADGNRIVGNDIGINSLAHPWPPSGPGSTWDGLDVDSHASNTDIEGNTLAGDILIRNADAAHPAAGNRAIGNTINAASTACIILSGNESGLVVSGNTLNLCHNYAIVAGGSSSIGQPSGAVGPNSLTSTAPVVLHAGTSLVHD